MATERRSASRSTATGTDLPGPNEPTISAGTLWATDTDGGVWRCQTPVGDRTVSRLTDPADARSAGALVARFHRALRDLRWDFRSVRPGAQDTVRHLASLRKALADHHGHRLYDDVSRIADEVFEGWRAWEGPGDLPERIIHGDLKISNVRFTGARATALIRLSTAGPSSPSACAPRTFPSDLRKMNFNPSILAPG